MIKYGKGKKGNAIKVISRKENNGVIKVREKIIIHTNYQGDDITLVGWNGLSRERTFLSKDLKRCNKVLRNINNKMKGTGYSNPTRDTEPTLATTSK